MTYFFILGKNIKLSAAEIAACFGARGNCAFLPPNVLLLEYFRGTGPRRESVPLDADLAMKRLGGTIKIGEIIGKIKNVSDLPKLISEKIENSEGKFYFGISDYVGFPEKDIKRAAMEIKKALRQAQDKKSRPVRWVVSKPNGSPSGEKILSSVIVKTNKLLENGAEICLFRDGFVGKTLAVQEFEEYEKRDFGKPARNILRGMLPPKLAKIMINLSGAKKDGSLLDPFCGTGTVLLEAMNLGFKNLIGSDLDSKAIEETKKNMEWLAKKTGSKINYKTFISPADKISEKIKKILAQRVPFVVGAIVTEPYLGPLLRGNETEEKIKQIISGLENIYLKSFADWKKILKKEARVVIIFPIFVLKGKKFNLRLEEKIKHLGFKKIEPKPVGNLEINNLIYERPDQKILRDIEIFEVL